MSVNCINDCTILNFKNKLLNTGSNPNIYGFLLVCICHLDAIAEEVGSQFVLISFFSDQDCRQVLFQAFLNVLTGKNCFTQFSTRIYWSRSLAASHVFQSVEFFNLKGDLSNRQKMNCSSSHQVYGKIWLGFCLNTLFPRGFILKPPERAQLLPKKQY